MIVDAILLLIQGLLEVLLLPLTGINIVVDFIASVPVVSTFLQVVAYIFPWSNILPLIILTVSIIVFKTSWALIRTALDFLLFL